jgi:hypothetical protein
VTVIRTGIIILLVAVGGSLQADEHYIGTANADGSFWVDSAGVSTHATVFDGSTVEAGEMPVKLQIPPDVRILLDVGSRAQVWGDRLTLEKGRIQLDSGKNYRIEARTMRVVLAPGARAIVATGGSSTIGVTALGGPIRVANADGVLVANVAAGRSVDLRLGQAKDAAVLTGCVAQAGGEYLLRDEVSGITVALRGAEVAKRVGQRVEVTGSVEPLLRRSPGGQVIRAKAVKLLGGECQAEEAGAATGSHSRVIANQGSLVAATVGTHTAVIAGVAVVAGAGATAGTLAAMNPKKPRKPPKPAISHGR